MKFFTVIFRYYQKVYTHILSTFCTQHINGDGIVDTKANSEKIGLVFLLDRSGSMYGSEKDTIGGFNSFISREKAQKVEANVTTILFDHEYEMLYKRKDLYEVENLTEKEYYVRGSTALLDAIGKTILTLDKEIDNKVLFVITTDGRENASVEFTRRQIKNMINNHNWEFIYLGADIDSYAEAARFGIKKSRTSNYVKSCDGIEKMYNAVTRARVSFQNKGYIENNWKEDLE